MTRNANLVLATCSVLVFTVSNASAQGSGCSSSGRTLVEDVGRHTEIFDASFARASGAVVPFTAFSNAQTINSYGPGGGGLERIDLCLRYQIRNDSLMTIEELSWPVAGVPIYDYPILPNERSAVFPVMYFNTIGAVTDITEVRAFRGAPVGARTYVPLFGATRMPNNERLHPLGPSSIPVEPTLLRSQFWLQSPGTFAVTTPSDTEIELPEFVMSSTTPDGVELEYTSSLYYDEGQFTFDYSFSADGAQAISAPYLLALSEFRPSPTVHDSNIFTETIGNFRSQLTSPREIQLSFEVDPTSSDFDGFAAFVGFHPVSVETETGNVCFLFPLYSPIPIGLGANFCVQQ